MQCPIQAALSALSMSMDEKARIGLREEDVIGAHDIQPLKWTNRLKFERKKLCENARIPALGYGALDDKDECPKAPELFNLKFTVIACLCPSLINMQRLPAACYSLPLPPLRGYHSILQFPWTVLSELQCLL